MIRFLVICTYHPDTLTVRASFSVPGRGGVVGSGSANPSDWDTDRNARNRKFKMVGKSSLILKEDYSDDFPSDESVGEKSERKDDDLGIVSELINGVDVQANNKTGKQLADNMIASDQEPGNSFRNAKYARLVNEKQYINENYQLRSGTIWPFC